MSIKKTPKENFEFLKNIAIENEATLIETEWKGRDYKYSFNLKNGKSFQRTFNKIVRHGWEKTKAIQDDFYINELIIIAEKNNYTLLDLEWKGVKYKYCFENYLGQKLYRSYQSINTYGLPKNLDTYILKNNNKRESEQKKTHNELLFELKSIAIKNKGVCLEAKWLGAKKSYLFQDEFGGQFYSTPKRIKLGFWGDNRGIVTEPICRQILEHLFQYKFPATFSVLNAKLLNRKRNLELDGYNEKLNIAFEYQGHPAHWDINHTKYQSVHSRDLIKKEWCKKLGIILIEIPIFSKNLLKYDSTLILNHILGIIEKTFKDNNKELPTINTSDFNIQFNLINHNLKQIKRLHNIAKKHNGKLISKSWISTKVPYIFEDINGIQFSMSFNNYLTNGWPTNIIQYKNHQSGHKKNSQNLIDELKDIALKNNCKLIDNEWKGNTFNYSFLLSNNNILKKSAYSIKKHGLNTMLPVNGDKAIEKMKTLAENNKSKLLDSEWKGISSKYTFLINNNKINLPYRYLQKYGWPKNIDQYIKQSEISQKSSEYFYQELIEFVNLNNGKLITPKWLGNKVLHQFITEDGIVFEKKPVDIKRSGWYK